MNWYIGQPIVAIENHPQGAFKKGDDFTIKALSESFCKCKETDIDVGLKDNEADVCYCSRCRTGKPTIDGVWWFSEVNFAPLDTDISELTEILTQKQVI